MVDGRKLTTDDLVMRWFFEFQVRQVARGLLNASESEEESLARSLDFSDCPGSWLRRRLALCLGRRSREPKANHFFDAQRLAYLPYVDLLLTDHEMAERGYPFRSRNHYMLWSALPPTSRL